MALNPVERLGSVGKAETAHRLIGRPRLWDDVDYFRGQYATLAPYLNVVSQKDTMIREKVERGFGDRMNSLEEENRRQAETIALLLKHAGMSAELQKHTA